jgi:signal transduction histidine kinase
MGALQLPNIAVAALFLLAYIVLEWVSFLHEYEGVPVTPWNPGLGMAFALLVIAGPTYGLVLLAGVVIAELLVLRTELSLPVILAMAAIIAASYSAAAAFARRKLNLDVSLEHVRDVVGLLAAGSAGAAISATLLSGLLLAAGALRASDIMQSSLPLLLGDIIGIAVTTPLIMRLWARWDDMSVARLTRYTPEIILHLMVVGVTLWLLAASGPGDYRLFSLLFLPVIAAALRHGIDGSCLSLAAIQIGLVALLRLFGYDAAAFTAFQLAMLGLTMSGLLVGVVVSEWQRADVAARQAAERMKEMQAEAARADRMSMVSGMASALAHEINQPMTAARALARTAQQLLVSPAPDSKRVETNLSNLIKQIDHAGAVVHRMREFLRRGRPHFSTLDIGAVLEDAVALAQPEASVNRVALEQRVEPSLPPAFGDRIQLQQVVLNLVRNGLESIVATGRTDGRIRVGAHLAADEHSIVVAVADNGTGVAADQRLFEPLLSSKKDGLGLGLSICASIVQAHGGRIWLHAGDAGATELRFSLPLQKGSTN